MSIYNGEQLQSITYQASSKELTITVLKGGNAQTQVHQITSLGFKIKIKQITAGQNLWQIWMEDGKIAANVARLEVALKEGIFDLIFVDTPTSFTPKYVGIVEVRDARAELINFGGAEDYQISMHSENRGSTSEPVEYHVARVIKL